MLHTVCMPRKRKPSEPTPTPKSEGPAPDRHKPSRMTRIRERLALQLDLLADRRDTDFTEQVNRLIQEGLEREGLWPPPRQEGQA